MWLTNVTQHSFFWTYTVIHKLFTRAFTSVRQGDTERLWVSRIITQRQNKKSGQYTSSLPECPLCPPSCTFPALFPSHTFCFNSCLFLDVSFSFGHLFQSSGVFVPYYQLDTLNIVSNSVLWFQLWLVSQTSHALEDEYFYYRQKGTVDTHSQPYFLSLSSLK